MAIFLVIHVPTNLHSFSDLHKIYTSHILDPHINVKTLQNKVQWDICFYFARHGHENFYVLQKDWFQIKLNEKTQKNHKSTDEQITSGFMPEIKDDRRCPVKSFERFILALSPKSPISLPNSEI